MQGYEPMKMYWYAPFDNASESELAAALAAATDHDLTVHSCSHRFQKPLDREPLGRYTLIRDLPPPAGEMGERRTAFRQLQVVVQRSRRRRRVVRRGSFDVVHLHTFNLISDWVALRRLRRATPLLVQSVHDVRPQQRRLPRRIETALLGAGYRACSGIIVAHEHLQRLLVDEFRVPLERTRVVPLPVLALPGIAPRASRVAGAPLQVLFFGTFRENKGMQVLLDAIDLSRGNGDLRFVIAGRGDPALEDAVRAAALRDQRITAEVGYITDARRQELLGECHLLVLPYTSFNSQSGVLSRDAYGSLTPVIATRVGALGQAVAEDGSGWLVEPGDVGGLAEAFEHVLGSPAEYDSNVERIRGIASTRSVAATAAAFDGAYRYFSSIQT